MEEHASADKRGRAQRGIGEDENRDDDDDDDADDDDDDDDDRGDAVS